MSYKNTLKFTPESVLEGYNLSTQCLLVSWFSLTHSMSTSLVDLSRAPVMPNFSSMPVVRGLSCYAHLLYVFLC